VAAARAWRAARLLRLLVPIETQMHIGEVLVAGGALVVQRERELGKRGH
jgi:hypothetical protein